MQLWKEVLLSVYNEQTHSGKSGDLEYIPQYVWDFLEKEQKLIVSKGKDLRMPSIHDFKLTEEGFSIALDIDKHYESEETQKKAIQVNFIYIIFFAIMILLTLATFAYSILGQKFVGIILLGFIVCCILTAYKGDTFLKYLIK